MNYRVAEGVGWVAASDPSRPQPSIYVMRLPNGPPLLLSDTAASIWSLAAQGHDVIERLAVIVGRPVDDIAEATERFLTDLVARRLLERVTALP